jgi:phosphate transport system substrate-binding protein
VKCTLRRGAALSATAALALGLSACGAANEVGNQPSTASAGSELSGQLVGAGASSQQAAMQAWIAGFTGDHPGATIAYDPVGSGGGREQFLSGATDFAGSDSYLSDEELARATARCEGAGAIDLPTYISPIAVVFNLEGVDALQLSPQTLAKIFDQKIKAWNDPAIAADNPKATLPDVPITVVNRSDDSGTTKNFTQYLAAAAGDAWAHEASDAWPVSGGEAAQGTSGVVAAVKGGNGTIGYADASQADGLGKAAVKVGNEYVKYSPEAAAKVVEVSKPVAGRPQHDLAINLERDTAESGAYPIVLVSYHVACLKYDDVAKAQLVKEFLSYVVSEQGQHAAAKAAGSAPISDGLRQQVDASIQAIGSGA